MIRFEHVSKHYGNTHALTDATFTINKGEFVFLIGPSGAGKTTLLRLIIHDILPTEGTIHVDTLTVHALPSSHIHILRRMVGTVFQDFKLLEDRTVFENVALALQILGKKEDVIKRDVMDVLGLVGLSKKALRFPQELSQGESQRTAIARAIAGGPTILLADEPTGNLDPETSWDIFRILTEINSMGTTVVMATHNAGLVNDLKKRTMSLRDGKIISDEVKGKYHMSKNHDAS